MTRKVLLTHIVLIISLLLTACASRHHEVQTPRATEPVTLQKEQVWQLVAMRGKAVSRTSGIITLTFNPESGNLSGKATCNSYFGSYTARLKEQLQEGDVYTLTISGVGSTKVYCTEADMNAESRYLALLPKADAFRVDAYTLTLYQKGKEILKYEIQ